ncbi:MAG: carbohydrate binding domain-containing protein, partial [Flavobacteriaceae bacterium]|nr:carbohydrate binding domain-containing protein [Flavobacteriaceae bacterium]
MRSFIFLFSLTVSIGQAQNIIENGNFQTGNPDAWLGYNNQVLTDDQTNSLVGNVNNGEGSLYQVLDLEPMETYVVAFNYRWVSGSGNYTMNVRAKDENSAAVYGNLVLDTTPDQWMFGTFTFTVPASITQVRLVFF